VDEQVFGRTRLLLADAKEQLLSQTLGVRGWWWRMMWFCWLV